MNEWKKIRTHYIKVELLGMATMALCFGIGVWCDWNVIVKNNVLIAVEDIDAFSLTILQIQASVGTLVIAIIALITGNITDSYMGISISDFYLNIKPWKLTQKRLVFLLLGFSLAGVIFHSFGLYNIVFYMFICTMIGIVISIMGIYSAFRGRNKQNQEIEAYIHYVIDYKMDFGSKLNVYQSYVLDWEKQVEFQDKQSYEKHLEIFRKFMLALCDYEADESFAAVEQQSYSMAYCLLGSEKSLIKERGIEFIQKVYDTMWSVVNKCIIEKRRILNQYKSEFPLFSEICNELIQSMDELNVENVEKRIRLGNLIDSVQRIAIWFRYDEDENEKNDNTKSGRYEYNFSSEINQLNSFARYIGYYLGKQQNKNNIINQNVWADTLKKWSHISTYNVPEERMDDFLKSNVWTYFCYCYGLLVNGQENIVKRGLYLKGMKQIIKLDNKYQALMYMTVHCYVYYLAVRESDDCVPDSVRKSANNIWSDIEVKDAFIELLNTLVENAEWLDLNMLEQMYKILDKFELFSKYESVKSMIIEYVVADFYLFIILFMSHQFCLPELLDRNINDMEAFRYVSEGNEDNTKEMLSGLYKEIFIGNKTNEQINVEVDLMYDSLEKMVKKKQKERYIKLAKQAQEDYEQKINEKEICDKIKRETIKCIKDKFRPILIDNDEENGIIDIDLLKVIDYTSLIGTKNCTSGYYSHMQGMFLYGIEKFLYKRNTIEQKNRYDDFADDKEFMDYLSGNNLHLLLGSPSIFKNRDYALTAEYSKFLENYETIYTSVVQDGIALKSDSIKVCLHDINISIHSPNINEVNAEYNQKTGKYNYSIINGLPIDFGESELREFLYNNRKVLNITAKVSIQERLKPAGTIFVRGKRESVKLFL